jgi:hypothetical protein
MFSETGFINSYSLQNGIKKLVHVEDSKALFKVGSIEQSEAEVN